MVRHGAGVLAFNVSPQYRGRGIGATMLVSACQHAVTAGASTIVLLASTEGRCLYANAGFQEVGRFAYWYRSFQR